MSIQTCIKQAADEKLGPLASAIILNGDFSTEGSYDPYFEMLLEELVVLKARADTLLIEANEPTLAFGISQPETARSFILMIQAACRPATMVLPAPSTPAVPIASGPVVATTVQMQPLPNPTGSNSCFVTGCGQKFTTFHEAMAHKCLAHGYNTGRWTIGWAKDFMDTYGGAKVAVTAAVASPASPNAPDEDEDRSNPNIQTVSARWVPTLNLDLANLGLAEGEASRFAVGDDDNARFFFIRHLKLGTTIKGKFAWTKFKHRFYSETVHPGDFVVRKEAGDTKEWVGMQRKSGVWNPDFHYTPAGSPAVERYVHQGIYVGDYEADIEAIMADPHKARVRYGKLIGSCGYCGRKLTDPVSRNRGIGPDCWEDKGYQSWLNSRYSKPVASS